MGQKFHGEPKTDVHIEIYFDHGSASVLLLILAKLLYLTLNSFKDQRDGGT